LTSGDSGARLYGVTAYEPGKGWWEVKNLKGEVVRSSEALRVGSRFSNAASHMEFPGGRRIRR
jgi:hypothetical protein